MRLTCLSRLGKERLIWTVCHVTTATKTITNAAMTQMTTTNVDNDEPEVETTLKLCTCATETLSLVTSPASISDVRR